MTRSSSDSNLPSDGEPSNTLTTTIRNRQADQLHTYRNQSARFLLKVPAGLVLLET